jgi:hypothetical protein
MRFYEITPTKIIDLKTVRTAQVINEEIWITFNCGSDSSERATFKSPEEARIAYKALVTALYDL